MRSETDTFCQGVSSNMIIAIKNGDDVDVLNGDRINVLSITLTKQQAREFARQLLDMCGDEDAHRT